MIENIITNKPPKPTVTLLYNGKDCSEDFSRYLCSLSFQDFEDEQSDELSITLNDNDGCFSDIWAPKKGDTISAAISFGADTFDCGTCTIDDINFNFSTSGDSLEIKALATSTNFSVRSNKYKNHTGKTLIQIANEIGKSYGFSVLGDEGNLKVGTIIQKNESDIAFLKRISKAYGYIFNIKDGYLTFIKVEELENQEPLFLIEKEDTNSIRLKDSNTKIYGKCKISYLDSKTKSLKTYTAVGNTEITDTLTIYEKCGSLEEAQKRAAYALKNSQKEVTGSISIALPIKAKNPNQNETDSEKKILNPVVSFIAGVNFSLTGIGKFEGKYHIKSSKRTVDSSGLKLEGDIIKCM